MEIRKKMKIGKIMGVNGRNGINERRKKKMK